MRCTTALILFLVATACAQSKVDRDLVGTWELNVPNADGVARWVWAIHANGTYDFHAEGPGNVPAHNGTFTARNGKYSLHSTTMTWDDDGTYAVSGDSLSAAGKLGSAVWMRVRPGPMTPTPDSSAPESADTSPSVTGKPGIYTGAQIYDLLSHDRFDSTFLDAPEKLAHYVTVDLDAQQKADGVVGMVEADVAGSNGQATITFVVYRDRAAAEAAHDVEAVYDSKNFRMKPGEFVGSHVYSYRERGEAQCLSRHTIGTPTATATCYLLVQYPTREPVMIESATSESVAPKAQEASASAIERTDDLLFAGIKEWAAEYSKLGR